MNSSPSVTLTSYMPNKSKTVGAMANILWSTHPRSQVTQPRFEYPVAMNWVGAMVSWTVGTNSSIVSRALFADCKKQA